MNRYYPDFDPERPSTQHLSGFVHVVDDDASFRTATERVLKLAGYEVATYASAQHLLDRLPGEGRSSCILLDVRMHRLSGPELQSRLSELGSMVPIIFLTGYPDTRTTVLAIKGGADDFLVKPVKSDTLLEAVARAMSHKTILSRGTDRAAEERAHLEFVALVGAHWERPSRHRDTVRAINDGCSLLRPKQTCAGHAGISPFDPKRCSDRLCHLPDPRSRYVLTGKWALAEDRPSADLKQATN